LAAVSWSPGDAFLARYESADGVIRGALPLRIVGRRSGYLATWLPGGTTVARPVLADGRGLRECSLEERYSLPRASRVAPMDTDPAVILFPDSAAHSIHVFAHGWYVNLERKHVWHERGLDTRDHLLDIVQEPERVVVEGRGRAGGCGSGRRAHSGVRGRHPGRGQTGRRDDRALGAALP
jgi:Protein of unknown function (DUF402)